ncbi:MAG TPA: DUF4142 domain-containing protein [Candidatus Baltobacteraceae bacterium]|nr:DUF4142 domain-containing protein [Candidatus Baltobacteraceae bacterium]
MTSLRSRAGALCAALLISIPLAAAAPASAQMGQDARFVRHAAEGGMAEVRMARLALSRTTDPMVRAFARRMLHDHIPNNAQLAAIARSENRRLPSGVGAANAAVMARLEALSGRAFDRAYIRAQIPAHEQMLALLQNEISSGSDPRLVSFARTTVPIVREHLALARRDAGMIASGM